ncbi:MAG: hypothetical protein ACKVX7_17240 [Planctomycetota bacterium]
MHRNMTKALGRAMRATRVFLLIAMVTLIALPAFAEQTPPPPRNPLLRESRFVGTFRGEALTLFLSRELKGELKLQTQTFPVRAQEVEQELHGEFTAEGATFTFFARFDGEVLVLASGGSIYKLQRLEPPKPPVVNPLDPKPTSPPPAPPPRPLAGKYTGEQNSVLLITGGESDEYVGELSFAGVSGRVRLKGTPTSLEGSIRVGEEEIPIRGALLAGRTLRLETTGEAAGETLVFQKVVDAVAGTPSTPRGEEIPVERGVPGYRAYQHPLGIAFEHPQDWTVQETPFGLQLLPAGPAPPPGSFVEGYVVALMPLAGGVTQLDDPRVGKYLDGLLKPFLPFLARSEGAERTKIGVRYRWQGTSPAGVAFAARVDGRLCGAYCAAITAIGERDKMAERAAIVEQVSRTLTVVAPQVDPQMIGTWYSTSSNSSGLAPNDRITVSHTNEVTLRADGIVLTGGESLITGTTGKTADNPGTDVSGHVQGAGGSGRWAAAAGQIYILWHEGGATRSSFFVQGQPGRREALLTDAQGNKQLWTEYRD